ncbi:MAG TPA: hypothetical protein VMT67_10185 [Terriglobales bacterium]|nr:hypothetical protein [Terriglobales bacterium]
MARLVAYTVMMLALLGLLLSLGAYVFEFAGIYSPPQNRPPLLFFGIFIVWFPTIFLMNKLTEDFKQKDMWKAALRGCPPWMRKSMWAVVGVVSALAYLPVVLKVQRPYPDVFVLFPGCFYAASFCITYSVINAWKYDSTRRCLNGHAISPLAKFCDECGAPAAPGVKNVGVRSN